MSDTRWIAGILLGLAANGVAEAFLAFDIRRPLRHLDRAPKRLRLLRWLACSVALVFASLLQVPISTLIVLALFSVSAATDLETKLLPPDWFVFGGVVLAMLLAAASGDWRVLRDVAVAQAFCFAIASLGVAFFNLCDSGDIKLAMQFGAACGSLSAVAAGATGMWLAACMVVIVTLICGSLRMPLAQAWHRATHLHLPQGPFLWFGLLMALWWMHVGGLP